VTIVRKHREEQQRLREIEPEEKNRVEPEREKERSQDTVVFPDTERASFLDGSLPQELPSEVEKPNGIVGSDVNERDAGGLSLHCVPTDSRCSFNLDWVPGQGVRIDYAAMVEILIQQLDTQRD
jgi:vacuole morphology and inheritance protein 14